MLRDPSIGSYYIPVALAVETTKEKFLTAVDIKADTKSLELDGLVGIFVYYVQMLGD